MEDGRHQSSEASTKFANTKNNDQNSRVSNLYVEQQFVLSAFREERNVDL